MVKRRGHIGTWGESQAVAFLKRQKYIIIERNFKTRQGEIDIVASFPNDPTSRCFIEVKTRQSGFFAAKAERATSSQKLRRLYRAAQYYCVRYNIPADKVRIGFEHISVYVSTQANMIHFKKYGILP